MSEPNSWLSCVGMKGIGTDSNIFVQKFAQVGQNTMVMEFTRLYYLPERNNLALLNAFLTY